MRRSTYTVTLPDGREETLDRAALTGRIERGEVGGDALISVGGSRARRLDEHPSFRKIFGVQQDASASASPSTSRRTAAEARAPRPTDSAPPAPEPISDASADSPMRDAVAIGARGPVAPADMIKQPVGRPELPVSASTATPLPESILENAPVEIRDMLWSATPEQVVGCRVEAGRAVGLRSAGLRLRQLKARAAAATSAADRLRLEECVQIVDASMRIVTQTSKWRQWQQAVLIGRGDLTIGAHAKILRGDLRASGGRRAVSRSAPARPRKAPRAADDAPNVLGKEMLAAAGISGFARKEDDDAPGARKAAKETVHAAAPSSRSALDVPPWLRAPTRLTMSGEPTTGDLVWAVGTQQAGLQALGVAAAVGIVGGLLVALGAPGGANEMTPQGVPLAALLRMLLYLLAMAAVFQSVRKEGFHRVGWPVEPQDAMVAIGAAVPGLLLFSLLMPVPVAAEGAAMLPVALLLRAIGEWALLDVALTRTLLIEWEKSPAAIAVGAFVGAPLAMTYAVQWGPEGSILAPLVWAVAVGAPCAWSVYRAGSAVPALLVRVLILVGGAVLGMALG